MNKFFKNKLVNKKKKEIKKIKKKKKKKNLEIIWRLLFGIGTLPAIGIFYHRWTAKESKEFRRHSISDMRKKRF